MNADFMELLKTTRIFSSLGERDLHELALSITLVEIPANKVLFYQGEKADTVFLLIEGKLAAEVISPSNETRIIGHIETGDIVGELGALTDEPRATTVRALTDARLLRLPSADFMKACHAHPAVLFATLNPIITRSRSMIQMLGAQRTSRHVLLVPANRQTSLKELSEKLRTLAENMPRTLVVSDYQEEFNDKNMHHDEVMQTIRQVSRNKKSTRSTIYILSAYDTPLARVAFKKADLIYVSAYDSTVPGIDRPVMDKVHSRKLHLQDKPILVLLHAEKEQKPRNTEAWLSLDEFSFHHHVRVQTTKDCQRLLRFMRGRAVGLVLSGGGTRGWAHLGAIKALREAKIPIDVIGGTSAGAVAGACYAFSQSFDEAYNTFQRIVVESKHSISWRSLTWPVISLFNGGNFTHAQKHAFDEMRIEDLWLPFFCVSCNLNNNSEEVHRTGLLWEKLRASSSIPGIIPPMVLDGDMHFDGGLLNNLPVDVMRSYVGTRGRIIAVELNNVVPEDDRKYEFPPILGLSDTLLPRLLTGRRKYVFPRFMDVFLRALFIGADYRARQNSLMANSLISLDLSKFRMLHSNPDEADELIRIGYEETLKQIK